MALTPKGKPMAKDERKLATLDEVYEALEALDESQHATLYARATNMIYGTRYREPLDLVRDAMLSAIEGALLDGAKGRVWPMEVPLLAFLTQAMKGIASNSRTSLAGKAEVLATELVGSDDADPDETMSVVSGVTTPGVDDELIAAEDAAEVLRQRDELFTEFETDDEITMILMAMEDGLRGEAIRCGAGLEETQYETARRRLRRGVAKLQAARSAR